MIYSPTDIARQYLFVKEAGPNTGQRVEAIQRWCGGQPGESYCAYFATMVLDICFQGNAPIPREGAVQTIYNLAKQKSWMVNAPLENDLFIYVNAQDHAHHIGFVTVNGGGQGIAGNTSPDGLSDNGDGVHEHRIGSSSSVKYIRFPR